MAGFLPDAASLLLACHVISQLPLGCAQFNEISKLQTNEEISILFWNILWCSLYVKILVNVNSDIVNRKESAMLERENYMSAMLCLLHIDCLYYTTTMTSIFIVPVSRWDWLADDKTDNATGNWQNDYCLLVHFLHGCSGFSDWLSEILYILCCFNEHFNKVFRDSSSLPRPLTF